MFQWLKQLFHRPRLIERYEDLDSIIEAHNTLIQKTLTVMSDKSVPPKYVLMRFKAIQDAEEKAIAAYWRNKDKKCDKWYRRPIQSVSAPKNDTKNNATTDIVQEKAVEARPEMVAATPTVEAIPPTVEAVPLEQATNAQALEQSKDTAVVEIHINK